MTSSTTTELREANIKAVVDAVRTSAANRRPAVFLIGAGCSLSAGIPLARDVIEYVRVTYPTDYENACRKVQRTNGNRPPKYPEVMASVSWQRRYLLFNRLVNLSWLNWTHVVLAYLMRQELIGRILTTNFDDLILRACALYGCYPAVHDLGLAAKLLTTLDDGKEAGSFGKALSLEPAVFYLHGRHNGFFQAHSTDEVDRQAGHLEAVIDRDVHDHRPRPWVIVGYSGDSDPLFKTLKRLFPFPEGLYWVNLREPPSSIAKIIAKSPHAAFVRIRDADEFFLTFADQLRGRRLPLQITPFLHPLRVFHGLRTPPRREPRLPEPRRISNAVNVETRRTEGRLDKDAAACSRAERLLSKGALNAIIQFAGPMKHRPLPVARILAEAYMKKGDEIIRNLPQDTGAAYRAELRRARQCYDRVNALVAHSDDVLRGWARTLKKVGGRQVTPSTAEHWRSQVAAYDAAKELGVLRAMALMKSGESLVLESQSLAESSTAASALQAASRQLQTLAGNGQAANVALTLGDVLCARVRCEGVPRPGLLTAARKQYQLAIDGLAEAGRLSPRQRLRARSLLRAVHNHGTQEQDLTRLAAVRGCLGGMLKLWGKP